MENEAGRDAQIARALDLLVMAALKGMKQRDQIVLLERAGYGQKEIARLVGSTPKAVSVRLAEIRRENKQHRKES